jgi:hypothetical protein
MGNCDDATPHLLPEPKKTHRGENFPVASILIAPKYRSVILPYYRFARGADDLANSPSLSPDAKLTGLDRFEGMPQHAEAARNPS